MVRAGIQALPAREVMKRALVAAIKGSRTLKVIDCVFGKLSRPQDCHWLNSSSKHCAVFKDENIQEQLQIDGSIKQNQTVCGLT